MLFVLSKQVMHNDLSEKFFKNICMIYINSKLGGFHHAAGKIFIALEIFLDYPDFSDIIIINITHLLTKIHGNIIVS